MDGASDSITPEVAGTTAAMHPEGGVSVGFAQSRTGAALVASLRSAGVLAPDTQATAGAHSLTAEAMAQALISSGEVSEACALDALAATLGTDVIDLRGTPVDAELADHMRADQAIALCAVPYREIGGRLVVATARPDLAPEIRAVFPERRVILALAPRDDITDAIGQLYGPRLARIAESRAPAETSARTWRPRDGAVWLGGPAAAMALGLVLAPSATLLGVFAFAGLVFLMNMVLKLAAVIAAHRPPRNSAASAELPRAIPLHKEPMVTILVALFNETDVAGDILARLDRLDYPRALLDVIFVLEEGDHRTRAALQACDLPHWARAITVPPGHPQTKPRALNYALPFARGTIIGVYDAEDAPEPDQIRRVVARFQLAPPSLACLQGQLDYYNAEHNWISRCFTLEYATWFRLMLPGVARMGLVVPLGGTTMFIKRDALVRVGAWDAHNVTEDAELGLRLFRAGYRTEVLGTTTFEEANSALWPWIKQRSRWLKGYAITWTTAMRRPAQLWRDLGARRFWGFQTQMAGTVLGFFTAPVLWSLCLIPLGLPHPMAAHLTAPMQLAMAGFFGLSLVLTLAASWLACRAPHLRRHRWFLPCLVVYFPLASIAALRAICELGLRPFHWAKTAHGLYGGGARSASAVASALRRTSNARLR